jgi:hypothetical protein
MVTSTNTRQSVRLFNVTRPNDCSYARTVAVGSTPRKRREVVVRQRNVRHTWTTQRRALWVVTSVNFTRPNGSFKIVTSHMTIALKSGGIADKKKPAALERQTPQRVFFGKYVSP